MPGSMLVVNLYIYIYIHTRVHGKVIRINIIIKLEVVPGYSFTLTIPCLFKQLYEMLHLSVYQHKHSILTKLRNKK